MPVVTISAPNENIEFSSTKNMFSMSNKLPIIATDKIENIRNECVICLDEFSVDNPPMLTLCACGENRTSFHYHCLLLWLQRKTSCPNCARRLYYQVQKIFFSLVLTYDCNPYFYSFQECEWKSSDDG